MEEQVPLLEEADADPESPPEISGRPSFSTASLFRAVVRSGAPDLVNVSLRQASYFSCSYWPCSVFSKKLMLGGRQQSCVSQKVAIEFPRFWIVAQTDCFGALADPGKAMSWCPWFFQHTSLLNIHMSSTFEVHVGKCLWGRGVLPMMLPMMLPISTILFVR
jgi:hypothetical protein